MDQFYPNCAQIILRRREFYFLQIKDFSILKKETYELSLLSKPKWWCNHSFVQAELFLRLVMWPIGLLFSIKCQSLATLYMY